MPHSADHPVVFVTRLRVRSLRRLPAFLRASLIVAAQASRSDGFAGGRLGFEAPLSFWTLTVWEDSAVMGVFAKAYPHRAVMCHTAEWAREASNAGWDQDCRSVPSWAEARRRLTTEGRAFGGGPAQVDRVRRPLPLARIPRRG